MTRPTCTICALRESRLVSPQTEQAIDLDGARWSRELHALIAVKGGKEYVLFCPSFITSNSLNHIRELQPDSEQWSHVITSLSMTIFREGLSWDGTRGSRCYTAIDPGPKGRVQLQDGGVVYTMNPETFVQMCSVLTVSE